MVPTPALRLVVCVALVLGTACGDGGTDDPAAFCAAIADLRENDPFADLAVASPGEMRDAFAALADGADRIADAAPREVEVQARRYAGTVDALRDELAAGGYDPTRVDNARYGAAVADYTVAATSVGNAAEALCDEG